MPLRAVSFMNEIEICPGVFQLEDDYRVYCVFVAGKSLSVLWDTGTGKHDLAAWARAKGAQAPAVLNSHGHFDHVGGNFRFPRALLAREDMPLLCGPARWEARDLPVGAEFPLGDEVCVCVDLSGHTAGSRGLLLKKRRLLLSGDALEARLRLMGPLAGSLSDAEKALRRALGLPFDAYIGAHTPGPQRKEQIELHIKHIQNLRNGSAKAAEGRDGAGRRVWRSLLKSGALRSAMLSDRPLP